MLPTVPLPGFHLSCLWFCLNDYNRIYSTANLSPVNHYFVRHKRFDLDLHHQHLEEYQPSLKGIVVVVFLNLPLFNIYFLFHLKIVQCPYSCEWSSSYKSRQKILPLQLDDTQYCFTSKSCGGRIWTQILYTNGSLFLGFTCTVVQI